MEYNIEELKNIWDFYDNKAKEIVKNAFDIIPKFIDEETLQKYRDYIEKNKNEEDYPFNIFELISDQYYKENFHSDIIAKLLQNEIVRENFLKFIGVESEEYSNCEVNREENKIDILIKSEKNCIIIENKLNWACDMHEQLSRYYNECKNNKNLKVDKVVYLSPNSAKKPEEHSIKDIPKELIKTIYGYDGENEDFYTMVLEKSLEEMNNKEPKPEKEWLLLLQHYKKILKQKGETKMDKLTKEFYEKILEDDKEYEKIKAIADMYNNLITTRINNLVSKFDGKHYKEGDFQCFYREFHHKNRVEDYVIDIYIDPENSNLYFFSRSEQDLTTPELVKIWEQDNKDIESWLKKHELFDSFVFDNGRWMRNFKFPEEEEALYDFTDKLIKCLEKDIESIYSGNKLKS